MKKSILLLVIMASLFASCTDADVASRNLSQAAEQFEIYRRVVFYNGITGEYILQINGYCSVDQLNGQLSVTIKTEDNKFLKHYLGLSDNVTYFSEQLEASDISSGQYRVIFKPKAIIPNIDLVD